MESVRRCLRTIRMGLRNMYDYVTAKYILFPLADLLHMRGEIDVMQMVVSSRVLDIQNYMRGDKSFHFQNRISTALWGEKHDQQLGDSRFAALIESVKAKGYDNEQSLMTIDRDFRLVDGTHRLAVAFVANVPYVRAKVVRWKSHHNMAADWLFLRPEISTEDLRTIRETYTQISEKLASERYCFGCTIRTDDRRLAEKAMSDIKNIAQIIYNETLPDGELRIGFLLTNPMLCVRKGKVVSLRVKQMEKMLKRRYPALSNGMTFAYNSAEGHEELSRA